MESKSLPVLGSSPAYELRRAEPAAPSRPIDVTVLERVEQRLTKGMRGVGAAILHDLVIPATGTTIDHLCIAPTGVTTIDVERDSDGEGREYLAERVERESQVIAAALTDALVDPEMVFAAICRATRPEPMRASAIGDVVVGGPRALTRIARRGRPGDQVDVQLALAVVRSQFGRSDQRALRITKPDGFLAYV